MLKSKALILLFFLLLSIFYRTPRTFAQTSQGLSLEPAFQEIVINTDQASVTAEMTITNPSSTPQEIELFAVDIQQLDELGNIGFIDKPQGNDQWRVAEFITFPNSEITINPNEQTRITFLVTNSNDLSPGGHYGAVIARFKDFGDLEEQKILPALSSLILLHKTGGEQYSIALRDVGNLPTSFSFFIPQKVILTFENNGNIHTTPYGTVIFKNIFGKEDYKGIINESSSFILPATRRQIPVTVGKIGQWYPFMLYTVEIQGKTRPGDVPYMNTTSYLYISPIGIILVILICAIILGRKKIRAKFTHAHTAQQDP